MRFQNGFRDERGRDEMGLKGNLKLESNEYLLKRYLKGNWLLFKSSFVICADLLITSMLMNN
jgi:hypothetical protein